MAYTTNENMGQVRVKAIKLLEAGKSTREVARHLGYAQSTMVKWWKRRNEVGRRKSLPTRSSRPHNSPGAIPKETEARIIAKRLELKRCSEVVYESLKAEGIIVSLATVKRVLSRYNMLKKRSHRKPIRKYPIRPGVEKQGDLVQIDTIHFVEKEGKRNYVYTAIDVYSRYGYAMLSTKANTHKSIGFLKEILNYFSFPVSCVQTDNGPEFGLFFNDYAKRTGIAHRYNRPRRPNQNGHLERFNRTIQEEMPRHHLSIHLKEDILAFIEHYNTQRIHMGINFKTPAQMLQK